MPDAWTILKDNSTLAQGDAWEHLNNQGGGVCLNNLTVNITTTTSVNVNNEVLTVDVDCGGI